MRICSITFSQRTDDLALDALRSALPHVDVCLLIDTHPVDDPDALYPFTREREVAGDKLLVYRHGPITWDTPACQFRNFGLELAATTGCHYAITLDTDERLHLAPGFDIRAQLARTTPDLVITDDLPRSYSKERIFSLPARGKWLEATHEWFDPAPGARVEKWDGLRFSEIHSRRCPSFIAPPRE